jgi:centromere protein J
VAEAVAAKVADLDAEMAAMKSERSATARAKHAADALLQEMRRKREEVGEWAAAEKASVEQWCTEQRAALVKERRLVQRQAAGLVIQPPSKKERAEIEALKATVNTLKMEESRCKGRFKLTEQRLKQSLQEAEAKRTELDDQVAFLERERVGVFAEMEALKQALNEANLRAEAAAAAAASSSSAQLGAPSQALPSRTQLQQVQQQQQQRQKLASNLDASRKPPQQPPLTAAPRSNPSHVSSSSAGRSGSNGQASSYARVGVPQPHLPGDDDDYDDRLAHLEREEEECDQRASSHNDNWGMNPDFHKLPTHDSLAKQDPFTNDDPTGHYDHHHYSQGSSNSSSSSAHVGGIAAGSGHNYDPTRYGGGDDSAALTSEGGMNPQQEPSTRAKPSQQEQQQPFDSRALDLPPSSTDEHPDQLLPPPPVSSSRSSSRQGTRPPNGPPSNSSKDDASKRATAAPGGSPAPDAQAAQAAPVAAPPAGPGSDKIERKFPDGRVVTWYSNGTHKERRPDGSTCVRFSNGDVKRTSADGAVTYFYESAKTTHSTFPNGDEVFEFPSGQVETHRANGAKEIKFPDGTRKVR